MPEKTFSLEDHYNRKIDHVSPTIKYIGFYRPQKSISDPVFQIRRETRDGQGRLIAVQFANKKTRFNNKWSDRATLPYE